MCTSRVGHPVWVDMLQLSQSASKIYALFQALVRTVAGQETATCTWNGLKWLPKRGHAGGCHRLNSVINRFAKKKMRLPVQVAKCAFGTINLCLGIGVEVSAKAIGVSLPRMRRLRLTAVIDGILENDAGRGWLPPGEAAELCGRLGFGSAYCLSARGRLFLGPLYPRAADKRATRTNWNLNDAMAEALRWRGRFLRSDAFGDGWVAVDRDDVDGPNFVIASSDASGEHGVGGTLEDAVLLLLRTRAKARHIHCSKATAPASRVYALLYGF